MKLIRIIILVLIASVCLPSIAQVKIGFVDTQRLLDTMPSRKIAAEKYQGHENDLYEELKTMKAEYDKSVADYQTKYNDLTPVLRQAAEKKILDKERQLQDRQQSMQQELQAFGEELNAPILERIQKAVGKISEQQKLSLVIDQSSTLYFAPELDVTDAVAIELLKLEKEAH